MTNISKHIVPGKAGRIAVHEQGLATGPAVYMSHSILSSSMMWEDQAQLLADQGYRVLRADTRGHGDSQANSGQASFDDLVADIITVLDALKVEQVHYVGLSLGGMSGFGMGIHQGKRLASLCICDARSDAPPAFAAPWAERITSAEQQGCAVLADSTAERWFGKAFLDANPAIAKRFRVTIASTSVNGMTSCARSIQKLDYLKDVGRIAAKTTLIVGANDGPLPQAMADIQALIPNAVLEVIPQAGHLPNIDQATAFNAALLRHFARAV
jgi:3-oxoadipate enol-lactonase